MENLNEDALNKILEKIEAKIEATVNKKVAEVIKRVNDASEEKLLTTKEAARHLGCSVRALYYYREKGYVKYYVSGGTIRYKTEDLNNFVKSGNNKLPSII